MKITGNGVTSADGVYRIPTSNKKFVGIIIDAFLIPVFILQ